MGTRPEVIKMAPVIQQFRRKHDAGEMGMQVVTVFTGQQPDVVDEIAGFFNLTFDISLGGVMQKGQRLSALVARLARALEERLDKSKETDVWVVQGDTTSVMAVAVLGFNRNLTVCHLEAGLRSGVAKQPFPEEFNRRVATLASQIHFAPTERARDNLLVEGVDPQSVFVTGNTVMDATDMVQAAAQNLSPSWAHSLPFRLLPFGAQGPGVHGGKDFSVQSKREGELEEGIGGEGEKFAFGDIVLVSLHRRESLSMLHKVFESIRLVECPRPCLFVILLHPNQDSSVPAQEACKTDPLRFLCVPALSYQEMHWILALCSFIVTDSGGLSEEASFYRLPVLVARNVTDRPESVEAGTALLVGSNGGAALEGNISALLSKRGTTGLRARMSRAVYPFGKAGAAARVYDIICGFACGEAVKERDADDKEVTTSVGTPEQGGEQGAQPWEGERVLCFSTGRYGRLNNDVISLVHAMYVATESGRTLVVHEPSDNNNAGYGPHSLFDVHELMMRLGLRVVIANDEKLPSAVVTSKQASAAERVRHDQLLARCKGAGDVGLNSSELFGASSGERGGKLATVHVRPSELFATRIVPRSFMRRVFSLARFPTQIMQNAREFVLKIFGKRIFVAVHSRRLEGLCPHSAQYFSRKLLRELRLQKDGNEREGDQNQLAGAVAQGIASMCELDAVSMMRLVQEALPQLFKKSRWLFEGDREVQGGQAGNVSVFLLSDRQGPREADGGGMHGAEGVHSVWCDPENKEPEEVQLQPPLQKGQQQHRPAGEKECVLFDMAVATLADGFIGNPLSTLSVNVARMRKSLAEAGSVAQVLHVERSEWEHEGSDVRAGSVGKIGGTPVARRTSVLLPPTAAVAIAEALQMMCSQEGLTRANNLGEEWSSEVEEALLWDTYPRDSRQRGEEGTLQCMRKLGNRGHLEGGNYKRAPKDGPGSSAGTRDVLPSGFDAHSTWVTRGECFSHVRSACLDMASGEILSFDDGPVEFAKEETLRTCYNPHCSSMGPGICSGHGTVRVKHYSSAASESAQGMPWEGGLGLAGLVQLHGRGILSEQGSSAAAFLSSWTMEGSLWHVVLDNIAGFWEMLHKHYAVDDLQGGALKCPDLEVIFTNEILGRKWEAVCISTAPGHSPGAGCGPWGNSTGLLFYTAFSPEALQGASTSVLDLRAGQRLRGDWKGKGQGGTSIRCYKDIFVGYPLLHPDWHEHDRLLTNFGDCLVQHSPFSPLRARRQAAGSLRDMRVLVTSRRQGCRRSVSNFAELERGVREAWTSRLKSINFVFFEDMEPHEQLRVVSEADVFVAPHGSALAWMTVMPRGGAVLVLRGYPNTYYPRDYLAWSNWVGVHYLEWSPSLPEDVALCDDSLGRDKQLEMLAAAGQGILPPEEGMSIEMHQTYLVNPGEFGDSLQEAIDTVVYSQMVGRE